MLAGYVQPADTPTASPLRVCVSASLPLLLSGCACRLLAASPLRVCVSASLLSHLPLLLSGRGFSVLTGALLCHVVRTASRRPGPRSTGRSYTPFYPPSACLSTEMQFVGRVWQAAGPQAQDLLRKLLTVEPEKRLTAQQALNHPWFDSAIFAL
jgi:serine/threonine protein kinase